MPQHRHHGRNPILCQVHNLPEKYTASLLRREVDQPDSSHTLRLNRFGTKEHGQNELHLEYLEPSKDIGSGLLIALAGVAGVLSQQGITLCKVGAAAACPLASALATALLGRIWQRTLSRKGSTLHGEQASKPAGQARRDLDRRPSAALDEGCSGVTVAQDIVNWTPSLQSAVATVDSTAALLAPADAPVFAAATTGFDAASYFLVAQARAFLANPSASALAQLQTQIVTLQATGEHCALAVGQNWMRPARSTRWR